MVVWTLNTSLNHSSTGEMAEEFLQVKYNKTPVKFIYVGIKRQKLYLIHKGQVKAEYPVSTSKFGCGQELNSEKTPLGLHRIKNLTGKNIPEGGIIIGPNYTGKNAEIVTEPKSTGKDLVTTRAMRIEGVENGVNKGGKKDTFKREIYIHGTPEEGLIGQPVSHGCIRMKNKDVIELFNLVNKNIYVLILNN